MGLQNFNGLIVFANRGIKLSLLLHIEQGLGSQHLGEREHGRRSERRRLNAGFSKRRIRELRECLRLRHAVARVQGSGGHRSHRLCHWFRLRCSHWGRNWCRRQLALAGTDCGAVSINTRKACRVFHCQHGVCPVVLRFQALLAQALQQPGDTGQRQCQQAQRCMDPDWQGCVLRFDQLPLEGRNFCEIAGQLLFKRQQLAFQRINAFRIGLQQYLCCFSNGRLCL